MQKEKNAKKEEESQYRNQATHGERGGGYVRVATLGAGDGRRVRTACTRYTPRRMHHLLGVLCASRPPRKKGGGADLPCCSLITGRAAAQEGPFSRPFYASPQAA